MLAGIFQQLTACAGHSASLAKSITREIHTLMIDRGVVNPYALVEAPRALFEMSTLPLFSPLLSQTPDGDGHGVFVIPGFGASDQSTFLLRGFLDSKGYKTTGWRLGRNLGLARLGGMSELLAPFLEFQAKRNEKITIVGWSLGGVHARRIARERPDLVRQVICLGSPIHALPAMDEGWEVYEKVDGAIMNNEALAEIGDFSMPPSTPSTAIFSKSDGVVPWQFSRELDAKNTDNIEIFSSHIGLGVNPSVFYIIADRLSQPDDKWRKFDMQHWKHRLALGILDPIGRILQSGFMTAQA
jgi:pimeloyl-ACP methyl ester carboxylesterase